MPKGQIDVKLTGFDGLGVVLSELPKRVASKGMRTGVDKASKPVVDAAKRTAPRGETRALSRSIGRKVVRLKGGKRTGTRGYKTSGYVAIVGARKYQVGVTKTGTVRVPSRYIHLVNKGVKPHAVNPGGKRTGQHPGVAARPFLTNALRNNLARCQSIAAQTSRDVIVSEAKKLAKGNR